MSEKITQSLGRRTFLKTAAAATAGLTIVKPGSVRGAEANMKLKLGIIGLGRGSWLGDLFQKHTNTQVTAVHDYFKDRVATAGAKFKVPENRRFTGLDGYKKMLETDVDAVAVISPPYFRPEQAVAVLDAGKHAYLAKPIAVDVPGCMAIVKAANKAQKKLTTLVDFQTRNDPMFREAARRVRAGDIGKLVSGQVYYVAGRLGIKAKPGTPEARLRNWVFDIALSGDIIVEQNIHVIDVANWYLQFRPTRAWGTGGRKVRTEVGDCWDHFIVTYSYPNDVLVHFQSTQFSKGYGDLCTRIFGSIGVVDSHYFGEVRITGDKPFKGGHTKGMFADGTVTNIKALVESIKTDKPINNAKESADSNLTCILGRTAAYEHCTVSWDEMIRANKKMAVNLRL